MALLAGIGRPGTCREAASWVQLKVKGQTMTARDNFIRFSLAEEKQKSMHIKDAHSLQAYYINLASSPGHSHIFNV